MGASRSFFFGLLTVSNCVLLQAICAKCSKTLDNKTSRVCPECFEASLSLENLGVSEQKRKAPPEVLQTKTTHTEERLAELKSPAVGDAMSDI